MKTFSKRPGSGEVSRHVLCAVCGSDCPREHWECDGFGFVRCCSCGHIYQDPQPQPQDLIGRYDEEYAAYEVENARNFLDLMLKGLEDVRFFDRMDTLGVDRSLLDIGCATGALLEYAAGRCYRVQGVEVCEPAARYGEEHRGVPIAVGTLEEVDLTGRRFGAAHFSHVIEHVPDPRAFLASVRELLVPGALMVLVTPNTAGLQPRLFGPEWRSAIADHVHLFSRRNLVRLLRESGFEVLQTQTWGGLGIGTAPRWIKRPVDRLAKRLGFGDVVLVLSRRLVDS
ncbi:MAG: class I SAM-dependent methyltransferase [Spirochaetota bacterium]